MGGSFGIDSSGDFVVTVLGFLSSLVFMDLPNKFPSAAKLCNFGKCAKPSSEPGPSRFSQRRSDLTLESLLIGPNFVSLFTDKSNVVKFFKLSQCMQGI